MRKTERVTHQLYNPAEPGWLPRTYDNVVKGLFGLSFTTFLKAG